MLLNILFVCLLAFMVNPNNVYGVGNVENGNVAPVKAKTKTRQLHIIPEDEDNNKSINNKSKVNRSRISSSSYAYQSQGDYNSGNNKVIENQIYQLQVIIHHINQNKNYIAHSEDLINSIKKVRDGLRTREDKNVLFEKLNLFLAENENMINTLKNKPSTIRQLLEKKGEVNVPAFGISLREEAQEAVMSIKGLLEAGKLY